jgi:microcystin-dependent protein
MEGFIGEIRLFGGNFAPKTWAFCQGQVLSIASNTALFSILGTTYGGNGQTTFGLPDLRGRVAIGAGQGPGLTQRVLGEMSGTSTNTLTLQQIPAHTHAIVNGGTTNITGTVSLLMNVNNGAGGLNTPTNNYLGVEQGGNGVYANTATSGDTLNAAAITVNGSGLTADFSAIQVGITGSGLPYNNQQPFLGMNYVICLMGVYPSRN